MLVARRRAGSSGCLEDGETLATGPGNHRQRRPGVHYLPVVGARKREISPRFLSEDERVRIADLRRLGRACGLSPGGYSTARQRSAGRLRAGRQRLMERWRGPGNSLAAFLEHLAWRDSTLTKRTNLTQPASVELLSLSQPGRRNWFEQQR